MSHALYEYFNKFGRFSRVGVVAVLGLIVLSGLFFGSDIKGAVTTAKQDVYCDQNSKHRDCCSPDHCFLVRQSSVYSECCGNIPNPDLEKNETGKLYPLLIAATPRSGTTFLTWIVQGLLDNSALAMDWTSVTKSKYGQISWMHFWYEPDDVYFGPAKLEGSKFLHVWHMLRDPLKTVTSIAFTEPLHKDNYIAFLNRHITVEGHCFHQRGKDEFQRYQCLVNLGLEFYTQWHEFLLQLQLPKFKLEDLIDYQQNNLTILDDIFQSMKMNLPPPNHNKALKLMQSDKLSNSRKHRSTLEWWELCQVNKTLTLEFLKLSHRLDYYHDIQDPCDETAMNHPPTIANQTQINTLFLAP